MISAIHRIRKLLDGCTFDTMYSDDTVRAAFERHLKILREASRGIPDEWKIEADPEIPWSSVKNLGNHLRHAYNKLDHEILWDVYENEIDRLEIALGTILSRHGPRRSS
jgi:uncharacterized protein with HEPN domain